MTDSIERPPRIDDPRFQRSLKALHSTMLEMAEDLPLQEISITALVQAAGVTRPTFYQHFTDIPEAARRVALARLEVAFPVPQAFPAQFQMNPEGLFVYVIGEALPVIRHLGEYRTFYLHIIEGAGNAAFFEEIVAFVTSRFLPDVFEPAVRRGSADRNDLMTVMAGGVMWLLIRWLRDENRAAPEEIAHRIAAAAVTMIASTGA